MSALSSPARADEVRPLRFDLKRDVALVAGAALVDLGLNVPQLSPSTCRMCEPDAFDAGVRDALRWRTGAEGARRVSDVLMAGVIPAGALANSVLSAWHADAPYLAVEDLVIELQAVMLASDLTAFGKIATARRRPAGDLGSMPGSRNRSFPSGHTTVAFSFAAAAGTISTMRGYASAPWVWAIGMSLAGGVGFLRIAGDAHWASDVIVAAAVSSGIGVAVPWFFHRTVGGLEVRPAPGGVQIRF
jgi:membrane-associated phospholipid phosphatase